MAVVEVDRSVAEVFDGVQIVDCDAHFTEPADLWTSRVSAAWKDRVPVQRTVDGLTGWYLDGGLWSTVGGNTIARGRRKVIGEHVVQPFDEVDSSAWDVSARLQLMDEMGIYAAVLYPNGLGFASNHLFAVEDLEQRSQILRLYNDFYVDIQRESGGRLLPQALLPTWDMDFTVAEMSRLLDQGVRGFTVSDKPELLGLPELDTEYFAPMWSLANEAGAVMNFHIGSGGKPASLTGDVAEVRAKLRKNKTEKSELYWSSFGPQRRLAILATQFYMSNARIIVNLCMSDMFDRYPNLKIASAESGIGWVPFVLEAMEFQVDEMVTSDEERGLQQRRPTEYFRDHIYVTFWFERVGPGKLIEDIGVNNVLVETDVPHPTCLYPGTREWWAKSIGHLDPHTIRRICQDNATELYNITLPTPTANR